MHQIIRALGMDSNSESPSSQFSGWHKTHAHVSAHSNPHSMVARISRNFGVISRIVARFPTALISRDKALEGPGFEYSSDFDVTFMHMIYVEKRPCNEPVESWYFYSTAGRMS